MNEIEKVTCDVGRNMPLVAKRGLNSVSFLASPVSASSLLLEVRGSRSSFLPSCLIDLTKEMQNPVTVHLEELKVRRSIGPWVSVKVSWCQGKENDVVINLKSCAKDGLPTSGIWDHVLVRDFVHLCFQEEE